MTDTVEVGTNYIVKTPGMLGGRARINGRRIGVSDVVNLHVRLGAPIEEVAEAYDLTAAQIYAALAYYYDHPDEIDDHLDEEYRLAEELAPSEEEAAALKAELEGRLRQRNPSAYQRLVRLREIDPYREMTPPEIAAEFGVSEQAIRKAASQGWIPARKAGKVWLIRRRDAAARWGKTASG